MATGVTSSVSVGFGSNSGLKSLVLESYSESQIEPKAGEEHIRVFPSYAKPIVEAVHGKVRALGKNIPQEVEDYVSFSESSESSLRYPPTGAVQIHWASFYNADPSVSYDEQSGAIVLSAEASGIVKVTYVAYYDMYVTTHGDAPCVIYRQSPNEDGSVPNYEPAYVVAHADGYELATLTVSGPSCAATNGGGNYTETVSKGDYTTVALLLEVDPTLPPNVYSYFFNVNDTPKGFTLNAPTVVSNGKRITRYCGCRVRVYPKGAGARLEGVNCAVSSRPVSSGSIPILQSLTFTGQQSVNLSHPPSGKVTLAKNVIDAATNFGNYVSVSLKGPGERVNEVVWESGSKYRRVASNRIVRSDEVVAVAKGNNTIPCYTWGSARYETDFDVFDVLFNWDDLAGWYQPAMVLCIDGEGKIAHLPLSPPSKGGVL